MSTSVRSRVPAPVIEPSTDFPTPDDGDPIHRAPLRIAALVIAGALVLAAVVGFVVGFIV
ncbi:MAG TPA: hypothetical protein VFT27_07465 [Actinomycetota bacterium]|nr:hypothetical protein [Actinomycetota bacterium]